MPPTIRQHSESNNAHEIIDNLLSKLDGTPLQSIADKIRNEVKVITSPVLEKLLPRLNKLIEALISQKGSDTVQMVFGKTIDRIFSHSGK